MSAGGAETISVHMPAAAANGGLAVSNTNGNGNGNANAACSPAPSSSPLVHSSNPTLVNKPTFLESPLGFRFLIMDAPNDNNLPSYIEVLKKKQVVVVTRVCDPTYSAGPLLAAGIKVVEIPFPDGDPPPPHVVEKWLALVDQVFKHNGQQQNGRGVELQLDGISKPAIAIHCVAGLGRAPVMVAIALVENGMDPFDAIAFIRKKRRGAINARQLKYIENYKPTRAQKGCCTVQ